MFKKQWQQAASFKGAPFFVFTSSDAYSRRGALHEFPQRDGAYFEDLGESAPEFTVTAYVTELSPGGYVAARDNLCKACRSSGVGELSHPYYGNLKVVCTGFSVSHDKAANGMAQFSLTFVEQNFDLESPAIQADLAAQVQSTSDLALGEAVLYFADNFNLQNPADFVENSAKNLIGEFGESVLAALPVSNALGPTGAMLASRLNLLGLGQMLFAGKVNPLTLLSSLVPGLAGLARQPAKLGNQVTGINGLISCASGDYNTAYLAQKQLWVFGDNLPSTPTTTANRKQQAQNQTAFLGLVQQSATIEAARCVPYLQFAHRGEAENVRDEICDRLDQEGERTKYDTLFRSLEQLRHIVVSDISARATDLAKLSNYTPAKTLPALVLSYDLYENLNYEADLVGRNKITHPGFVPGGQALEVLNP